MQLIADVENIGNLIHSSWGVPKNMSASNNGALLKVDKIVDNTPYFSIYRDKSTGEAPTKTWEYNRAYDQAWKIQFGVKYYFN